jgi:uncharacterized protein (DUF2267 family)
MTTGLNVFDQTLQETNLWLKQIQQELAPCDRHQAYEILRATLLALRDRLTPQAAVQLSAQLPMLVRGFYFESWTPADTPTREHSVDHFLAHVARALPAGFPFELEDCVRASLAAMNTRIDSGEVAKLMSQLPAPLRSLFPTEQPAF